MWGREVNGEIVSYPYSAALFRVDFPLTSPPKSFSDMSSENREPFGIVPVTDNGPATVAFGSVSTPTGFVKVEGVWTRQYTTRALTSNELSAAQLALQAEVVEATQQRLDTFAQTRNYSGILSACTYANSAVTKFQGEGVYAVSVRDATWIKLYEILDEVLAGTRAVPSGFAAIEAELPTLAWPA